MKEETIREETEKYATLIGATGRNKHNFSTLSDNDIHNLVTEAFEAGFKAALQLNKEEDWISVIDGMPEVDTPVLIITTSGVFKVDERFISRFSEDRNPKWRHTDEKYISSWMTLPSPPKVK